MTRPLSERGTARAEATAVRGQQLAHLEEVHLLDTRNSVDAKPLQGVLEPLVICQATAESGRRAVAPAAVWRKRSAPVVVVLWTAFFFRRTLPLPPVRTWACSRASLSLFMLHLRVGSRQCGQVRLPVAGGAKIARKPERPPEPSAHAARVALCRA